MEKEAAKKYSKIMQMALDEKIYPLNVSIDGMLARLEELEAMMSLVQQERNTDDTMSKINESDLELKLLFKRIDCLEKLIADINSNLNFLENQIEDAENSAGLSNNSTKIRNLLHPLLKMGSDHEKVEQHGQSADVFQTQHYFTKSSD